MPEHCNIKLNVFWVVALRSLIDTETWLSNIAISLKKHNFNMSFFSAVEVYFWNANFCELCSHETSPLCRQRNCEKEKNSFPCGASLSQTASGNVEGDKLSCNKAIPVQFATATFRRDSSLVVRTSHSRRSLHVTIGTVLWTTAGCKIFSCWTISQFQIP
jgi:hypothetical protein